MSRRRSEDAEIDLTPMIDVVFQLIIFFIVTIKMDESLNEDIVLEDAPHGPVIREEDPRTMIIEISKRGWFSIRNAPMSQTDLRAIIRNRYKRFGEYPVLIRADWRTQHKYVRTVMNECAAAGLWRINFAAVIEHKKTKGWHKGSK